MKSTWTGEEEEEERAINNQASDSHLLHLAFTQTMFVWLYPSCCGSTPFANYPQQIAGPDPQNMLSRNGGFVD